MAYIASDVRNKAEGLWLNIFHSLVPEIRSALDGDKILCPACRESLLRIDVTGSDGKTYCACGNARGFDFIMKMHDIGFEECVNTVGKYLDEPFVKKIDTNKLKQKLKEAAKEKKKRAKKWNYELIENSRGMKHAPDSIINMLTDWGWQGEKINARWKDVPKYQYGPYKKNNYTKQPCMLFTICNIKGQAISVQIIPIEGKKTQTYYTASANSVYVNLWGKRTKYIAEGVKTSFAAGNIFSCKVTPCVDANYLSRYTIKSKKIFADKDANKVGEIAAKEYCRLQGVPDKNIILPDIPIPDGAKGVDFYDLLLSMRGHL